METGNKKNGKGNKTMTESIRTAVEQGIEKFNGIVPPMPAWVAGDFLPPGHRLDLLENRNELGERAGACERWLASTTEPDKH